MQQPKETNNKVTFIYKTKRWSNTQYLIVLVGKNKGCVVGSCIIPQNKTVAKEFLNSETVKREEFVPANFSPWVKRSGYLTLNEDRADIKLMRLKWLYLVNKNKSDKSAFSSK
ncbi:MAG: hypothetical protein IAF38_07840 [Bacteroidia bacterium]|nr:hypothetical protein [Bacteroidia bacterium]